MNPEKQMNLTMLCDYYELTMTNGYYACGMQNRITYFAIFFRSVPDGGGFAIAAGLEQAIRYIQQLHFDEDDIAYLRGRKMFSEGFLKSLRNYRFTGDIWAVPEGTPIFPNEPIMTVRAPAIEAQIIETFLLLTQHRRPDLRQHIIERRDGKRGTQVLTQLLGISLMVDGVMNISTILAAVRVIRAARPGDDGEDYELVDD